MAQFVVRNIENTVKRQLQDRARKHGHSMEEEIRHILRNALRTADVPSRGLGTEISALFSKVGIDFDIPELRGQEVAPISFKR